MSEPSPAYHCYNHPERETLLRCNRCERPICNECAVLTPTGYRCKECVRGQQKIFETARPADYVFAAVIGGLLSFGGSFVAGLLGFFTLFIAPVAGVLIAEAIRAAVQKRRSRTLFITAAAAAALGAAPLLLREVLITLALLGAGGGVGGLLSLVWMGLYAFLVTSTVYYRLSGIQIGR